MHKVRRAGKDIIDACKQANTYFETEGPVAQRELLKNILFTLSKNNHDNFPLPPLESVPATDLSLYMTPRKAKSAPCAELTVLSPSRRRRREQYRKKRALPTKENHPLRSGQLNMAGTQHGEVHAQAASHHTGPKSPSLGDEMNVPKQMLRARRK